jgi:hypothetical protein
MNTLYCAFLGLGILAAIAFYWASNFGRRNRDSTSTVLFQMGHASLLSVLVTHLFTLDLIHHADQRNTSGWGALLIPILIPGFAIAFFTGATFAFTLAASAPISTGIAYVIAFIALFVLYSALSSIVYQII